MAVSRITREEKVEQSVSDFVRNDLFTVRAYPEDRVTLVDAFDPAYFEALNELDRSYVALGFNFDNGGTPAELGSRLLHRQYQIEVFVIADSPAAGRNLANAVRDGLEAAGIVPLKDIAQPGAPVIDYLIVDPVRVERQPIPEPKPWQENVWVIYVPIFDEYYPNDPAG